MEDEFQDILNSVKEKQGRSRLEPYGELIDELRRQGQTYRYISEILTEKCQFRVSKSTVNDFVRVRSRRTRNVTRRMATEARIAPPMIPKAAIVDSTKQPSNQEVSQRIAALKARKPLTAPSPNDFHFDATQPLRLITSGKTASDK